MGNDRIAHEVGEAFGVALRLYRDDEHMDRWATNWGTKTSKGLARTIFSQLIALTNQAQAAPKSDPAG
jgi:hypothetical protein